MEQYAKYLRKSRFDRDYADLSVEETLKRHEAILDKLAEDRGYSIAKTYYEVVSGESIAARPEIQRLLDEVNAGLYAGILVVDVERLARGNGADQAYISQVFQFSGTKIITPAKVYDPGNEFDEEYFEFGLFMSRREYKTINRRLVRGRDSSAAEGKYIGSIAPYGYRRVKLENEKGYTLTPNPEEAEVVRRIFHRFLQGDGTKLIANVLNDQRIPSRHGDLWTYSTIAQILTNPVYTGKIRRGWSKQIKSVENGVVKKRVKRHKNMDDYQLYDGLHPALIDDETFRLVQQLRLQRQPTAKVKSDFELQNAFAGLIYCGVCGKRIGRTTMAANQKNRVRLRCVNSRNCHNVSADYQLVENEIISALQEWLQGYKVKIDTVGFEDDIAACKLQLVHLDQEAAKLNAQMENAYDLVEQGLYTLDLFRQRREKLTAALDSIKQQQADLEATLVKLESSEATQQNLVPQTEALLASYAHMTNQERNALLKTILHRIEYQKGADGRIEIDLYPRLPRL
ncbi:MAG: recombinase family protein [Eubacteriales bacterium]|nr:recombinase family protein [Eubacteriales bacterium]